MLKNEIYDKNIERIIFNNIFVKFLLPVLELKIILYKNGEFKVDMLIIPNNNKISLKNKNFRKNYIIHYCIIFYFNLRVIYHLAFNTIHIFYENIRFEKFIIGNFIIVSISMKNDFNGKHYSRTTRIERTHAWRTNPLYHTSKNCRLCK